MANQDVIANLDEPSLLWVPIDVEPGALSQKRTRADTNILPAQHLDGFVQPAAAANIPAPVLAAPPILQHGTQPRPDAKNGCEISNEISHDA